MKKILVVIFGIFAFSCQKDYSRASLDVYGNGTIDYERCSIVITPSAIIIKKDTIVQNSNGSHWLPVVHVIQRNNKKMLELDSLVESTGFKKLH